MLSQYVNKPLFFKCLSNIAALVGMTTNLNETEICSALALQHPPTHSCSPWPCVQVSCGVKNPAMKRAKRETASWCQNVPWSETRLLAKGTKWSQSLAYPCTMPANLQWSPSPQPVLVLPLWLGCSSWLGEKQGWGKRRDRIGARSNGLGVM